jgi:hypothetical protein
MNRMMYTVLHTYNDGSQLCLCKVSELLNIPVWKGNRILDKDHVNTIKTAINNISTLDSGYKVVVYPEINVEGKLEHQKYLVDGQHRLAVIRSKLLEDNNAGNFMITLTLISLQDEYETIQYFNNINNVKPLHFKEDPVLIANKYISLLLDKWPNQNKLKFFRSGNTKRPYMSIDKLREQLIQNIYNISKIHFDEFIKRCLIVNNEILYELSDNEDTLTQRSLFIKFGLSCSKNWLNRVIMYKN